MRDLFERFERALKPGDNVDVIVIARAKSSRKVQMQVLTSDGEPMGVLTTGALLTAAVETLAGKT